MALAAGERPGLIARAGVGRAGDIRAGVVRLGTTPTRPVNPYEKIIHPAVVYTLVTR